MAKDKVSGKSKGAGKVDRYAVEDDRTSNRIVNTEALVATRAMLGEGFSEDDAIDLLEVVRPHLEGALLMQIRELKAEIARLNKIVEAPAA